MERKSASTLVTGGTGLVGQRLAAKLPKAVIASRSIESANQVFSKPYENGFERDFVEWDANSVIDLKSYPGIDHVVNLMGASIAAKRWSESYKRIIRSSRVDGTLQLINGLRSLPRLPSVFVSASAVGIYGDRADEILTEQSSPGPSGFLVDVCREWEKAALQLVDEGVRVVIIRIGMVLSRDGGALKEILPIFKYGVGGRLGTGKQWMSWIHIEDLANLIVFALQNSQVSGIVNAVAPEPIRNRDFTRCLGKQLRRPTLLPAPKFGLRLFLGEFADTLIASQRVLPEAAESAGFTYAHRDIESALQIELS